MSRRKVYVQQYEVPRQGRIGLFGIYTFLIGFCFMIVGGVAGGLHLMSQFNPVFIFGWVLFVLGGVIGWKTL